MAYIDSIFVNGLGYDHTTHEPCLYFKHHDLHGLMLILQQVDDFLIGTKNLKITNTAKDLIDKYVANPVHDHGCSPNNALH